MDGCEDCNVVKEKCEECQRDMATQHDEGLCNTGACGCKVARSLCWKAWNNNVCTRFSIYDPLYEAAEDGA